MSPARAALPHVFTIREIARAAGVRSADVRGAAALPRESGLPRHFFSMDEAVRLVRALQEPAAATMPAPLFAPHPSRARSTGVPLAASGALHALLLAAVVLLTSMGGRSAPAEERVRESARLVFLATPGPGGGGGGGGLRHRQAPPEARLRGRSALKSPVAVAKAADTRKAETPRPAPAPVPEPTRQPDPQPAPAAPTPPVTAPVVSAAADPEDRPGVVTESPVQTASNGPGVGGGTGTGTGTGSGEGNGAGIGSGSIAGTGGGPYRPGSGIAPPRLVHEVKPDYTEEGRRRSVEGDVVMEVVVRADGTVGAVRVLQGLGSGLDARAVDAVRQWTFMPARRFGTPVDVLVEVAVEFRLR